MGNLLIFPLVIGVMYFMMIRPQQQRVARQRALIDAIEVGDEIITAGGMIGRVRRLDDDRLSLEVSPGVEITMLRGAVAQKIVQPDIDLDDRLRNGDEDL